MNYAQVYVKTKTLTKTRLETLREDFGETLRELREVFDLIAQDFNKYPAERGEKYFTLEEKLYRIYAEMKAGGEKTEYGELVKDFSLYMDKKLKGII